MAAGGNVAVLEPPPPAAAAPAAKPAGLKKLSFGKIAAKKEDTKTAYPVYPDADKRGAEIAARILERTEQFEALKGALETDKAELKFITTPFYFQVNHGRHEIPSSVAVHSDRGEVLVTYQNRYSLLTDESSLLPILGDRVIEFFRSAFDIKIKGDSIPDEKAQDLMNELQTLFARYNCTDALELKEGVKPVKDFHAMRHTLTVEMNLELEAACPIVAMIKTKGRK
jgi:hypothetical protein